MAFTVLFLKTVPIGKLGSKEDGIMPFLSFRYRLDRFLEFGNILAVILHAWWLIRDLLGPCARSLRESPQQFSGIGHLAQFDHRLILKFCGFGNFGRRETLWSLTMLQQV